MIALPQGGSLQGGISTQPDAVIRQGMWSKEEDEDLRRGVGALGEKAWKQIAEEFMDLKRSGKQCRERWRNHLSPDVNKTRFTPEEDQIIISSQSELGNKWAQIARRLPGRPKNAVKNRWNLVLKKNIEQNGGIAGVAYKPKVKKEKNANPPPPTASFPRNFPQQNGNFVMQPPPYMGMVVPGSMPPPQSQPGSGGGNFPFNSSSPKPTRQTKGKGRGRPRKIEENGSDTGSDDSLFAKRGLKELSIDMTSRRVDDGQDEMFVPSTPSEKAAAGMAIFAQANNGVPIVGIKSENSTPRNAANFGRNTPTHNAGKPPTSGRNGALNKNGLWISTKMESPMNTRQHGLPTGGLNSLGLSSPSQWFSNMPLSCSNGEIPSLTPAGSGATPSHILMSSFPSSTRSTDSLTFGSGDFADGMDFDFEREFPPPSSKPALNRNNSFGIFHDRQGDDDVLGEPHTYIKEESYDDSSHHHSGLRHSGGALSDRIYGGDDQPISDRYGGEDKGIDMGSDMDIAHFLQLSPGFKKEVNAGFFADDTGNGTDHAVQNMLKLTLDR